MGNVQEEKKATITEIGERMRQAREKKGLTIEQAQKQTHIHTTVLSAIEDGRCDEILTPNYVKSFIKEYANFLGFDHQEMVSAYLALHPELKVRNINLGSTKSDQKSSAKLAQLIRTVRSVVVFIMVVALAVFATSKVIGLFKNLKNPKKVQASKSGKARTATSAVKSAENRKSASTKKIPFVMTLKVKSPVMVQLKKDGVLIFKRVLPKGTVETFTASSSVNIFVGRAEAIEIAVNGQPQGVPGRGVIRNLEITSNGVRVR